MIFYCDASNLVGTFGTSPSSFSSSSSSVSYINMFMRREKCLALERKVAFCKHKCVTFFFHGMGSIRMAFVVAVRALQGGEGEGGKGRRGCYCKLDLFPLREAWPEMLSGH